MILWGLPRSTEQMFCLLDFIQLSICFWINSKSEFLLDLTERPGMVKKMNKSNLLPAKEPRAFSHSRTVQSWVGQEDRLKGETGQFSHIYKLQYVNGPAASEIPANSIKTDFWTSMHSFLFPFERFSLFRFL